MRRGACAAAFGAVLALALAPGGVAATFTVTTTSFAESNGCAVGECNLTEAIQAANVSPGSDVIEIPSGLYQPTAGLPTLADVSVVGLGTPGPRIDGALAGNVNGLLFFGAVGASSVANVTITRFQQVGIYVTGGQAVTITGSYIGTDPSFATGLGNGDGVLLGSSNSIVGGDSPLERNVISGNSGWGVMLQGEGSPANNQILGNVIGARGDSVVALPNGAGGIWALNASNTRIGSGATGEGNSVGGNSGDGIVVQGASSAGTVVEGNLIGASVANTGDGVRIADGATNVAIGGPGSAANSIRSNGGAGIALIGSGIGGIRMTGNDIYANGGLGIDLGSDGVTANDAGDGDTGPNGLLNFPVVTSAVSTGGALHVEGTVGTDAGTGLYRIEFFRSTECNGEAPSDFGEGQVFLGAQEINAANTGGVNFDNTSFSAPAGAIVTTTVTYVPTGTTSEFSHCVVVTGGGGSGGGLTVTTTADSGPGSLRQAIFDANAAPGADTITFGIGTPELGPKVIALQTPLPQITDPVTIDGTTQPGYVASPNTPIVVVDGAMLGGGSDGLYLAGTYPGTGAAGSVVRALSLTNFGSAPPHAAIHVEADDVELYRNFIGVRPNGTTIGRNGVGIVVAGVGDVVGSTTTGEANLIVGSYGAAVQLEDANAEIKGNLITDVTGVAGSANGLGVVNDGATTTRIEGNTIRNSVGVGVQVLSPSTDVDVVSNRIYGNGGIGIDIGTDGVTQNSQGPGPVYLENFPVSLSATPGGGGLQVSGELYTREGGSGAGANQSYLIELFRNDACDPSGYGEGQAVLAQLPVTTNADGFASFATVVPGTTTGAITATATALDPSSGRATSEFSACLATGGGGAVSAVLDAVQTSVPATGAVPLASVPGSAFLPPPGATQSTALQGAPISNIPISNIPISNIPISNIPISNIPISNIGFADPTILPLLRAFPLSELPLVPPRSWPTVLSGSTFASSPLQTVTLQDALALPAVQALTMADLDLSRSRLGQLPAVATVLGTAPLSSLPLPGGANWCSLTGPGVQCSGSSSVLSIAIQGAPISNIPISNIPISNIPISNIPISNIPISNIPISNIPISNIPISNIGTLIDCTAHPCATATLYDAFVGHWFLPSATIGDLVRALTVPTDVTNGATLGDILILLFSSMSNVSWEQLGLDTAGLQAAAGAGNTIDWHADVGLTGGAALATVTLPKGTVYDPTFTPTVQSLPAGTPVPIAAPQIGTDADGNVTLEWNLLGVVGATARVAFRTYPPLRVGPQAGSLEATAGGGGTPVESDPAPFSVSETFEPNGEGNPTPIDPDSLYLSYVTQANDLDFYSLPAPPAGSTIHVYLSHLPADYDVAVYAPPDAPLRPSTAGPEQLDSPPLVDTGVPLGTEQAALSPETLDDLRIDQTRPLVGLSANRGTEDDSVVAISGGGSGNYLIQVTPYNGATSDEPYMLRVAVDPPRAPLNAAPLPAAGGTAGTVPSSLPAGTNTLFLWNRSQLTGLYGAARAAGVLTAMQDTQGKLTSLGFPSAIVGVDGNAAVASAYGAWNADPGDPDKANAVVRAINAVVDGLRGQPNGTGIRYLVLVGDDRAIPFARLEDYATISGEAGYAQSVGTDNELSAALGAGRMLSDDPYADTSPVPYLNRQLFVPDLSVGRLVETPEEIEASLERYRDFEGKLDPTTARVAGYDFLEDGSEAVRQALATRNGLSAPPEATLIGDTWGRDNLLDALFPAGGASPSIASINGHADHYRLEPPAGSALVTTDDLTAGLPNRLVFSMGCHAGLSVGDALVAGAERLDWPQAYGRAGASYLGNTTYGYGDTAVVAYSEELNHLLAQQVAGGGPIGDALRLAKNQYFSTRGVFGVYDEKAMAAFTLYGLPMWSIGPVPQTQSTNGPGAAEPLARQAARSARTVASAASPLAIPSTTVGTDPITGLETEAFDAVPAFTTVATARGTYLRGDSGVQVSHLRPIEPKLVVPLGGTRGHGALITALTSSDQAGVNPVYARPTVDLSSIEPELPFNDVAYPSKLLSVRTYQTVAGARQRLVVGTGQFFGNPTSVEANGIGTQRRYTRIAGQVYRSSANDWVAPAFTKIDAFVVSGNAAFSVDVTGGDAQRVLAGYRSGSSSVWQFADLAEGPNGHWSGGGPVAANTFEYFVQAVDEAGNVAVSTNKGVYFDGAPPPADPSPNGPLELQPPAPTGDNGWYTGSVDVVVDGQQGVPVQVAIDGGPFVAPGADGKVTVTGDGVHTVVARDATGASDTVLIPVDASAPGVVFETPADGASYEPGVRLPAAYVCVDRGSGAATCAGTVNVGQPISTTPGAKTFSVTTRDRAGNTATRSVTYTVAYRKILFSSTRTGLGDIYAIAKDGSGLTRLTTSPAPDVEPAWSPDGTKIAFASRRSGLDLDIFVMNADGSDAKRLTTARGDDTAPAWSPDGTRIAFQSARDGNPEIYVMNADGTAQTRLTSHPRLDTGPAWSPDGSKIAWSRGTLLATDIYAMSPNGTGAVRLVRDGRDPDWGPGGKIVFTRSLVGPFVWDVFAMNANGSGIVRLTAARGPDYDPAWSSDGEQIAFASGRGGGPNVELYVMQADGGGQRRVTTSPAVDRTPDW